MHDRVLALIAAERWRDALRATDGAVAHRTLDRRRARICRGLILSKLGYRREAIGEYLECLKEAPEDLVVLEAVLSLALLEKDDKEIRFLIGHILSGPFANLSGLIKAGLGLLEPPFGFVQAREGVVQGWSTGKRRNAITVEFSGQSRELEANTPIPGAAVGMHGGGVDGFAMLLPEHGTSIRLGIEGVSLWGSPVPGTASVTRTLESPPTSVPVRAPVQIVIPAYGGTESLLNCLESLAVCDDLIPDNVWLVDDCSPDEAFRQAIEEQCKRLGFRLLRRKFNAGFSAAVNSALRVIPSGDVVLLNSDTMVFGDWLRRLQDAAYSRRDIATVTPISNNGELVSHPEPMRAAPIANPAVARILDEVCRELEVEPLPVPTGVGFCLFIRADARATAGDFDEITFGRGYGEETDYCLRLSSAGWQHVVAPNVFVAHEGGASFGDERGLLAARNVESIHAKFPSHSEDYASWLTEDPLGAIRKQIQRSSMPRILQSLGVDKIVLVGGDQWHGLWGQMIYESSGYTGLTPGDLLPPSARLHFEVNKAIVHFINIPILGTLDYGNPSERQILFADLKSAAIANIVVESLSPEILEFLEERPPFVAATFALRDASGFCPRKTATVEEGRRCIGAKTPIDCDSCVSRLGPGPSGSTFTALWRERVNRQFREAGRIALGEVALAREYLEIFPDQAIEVEDSRSPRCCTQDLVARFGSEATFAVIGANSVGFGYANLCCFLLECFRIAPRAHCLLIGQKFGRVKLESFQNATVLSESGRAVFETLWEHGCSALLICGPDDGADSEWLPIAQSLRLPLLRISSEKFR